MITTAIQINGKEHSQFETGSNAFNNTARVLPLVKERKFWFIGNFFSSSVSWYTLYYTFFRQGISNLDNYFC